VAPLLALGLGLVLTAAYAWVLDDAFIYFRYADNAALLRAGLVFNAGEFVEGYTSPLWMLLLTALRALGGRYWPFIVVVGLGGMVATWSLAVRVNRRLSGEGPSDFHLPAIWIASCYAVQSHFTSGLETPLVQVFALCFAALIVEPERRWLQALVALGPLVRPELAVATGIAVVWCWARTGRLPRVLLGLFLALQTAWLSFRIYYYTDVVPNTFHLKDTTAVSRGLHYVHDTLRAYFLYEIVVGLGVLLAVAAYRQGRASVHVAPRAVMWIAALAHVAYVVRIGGDFVHYRYLAFPVLAMVASLGGVVERFVGSASRRHACLAGGIALTAFVFAAYPGAQLPAHPLLLRPSGDPLRMYRVDGVEDAAAHRLRDDLAAGWDVGTDGVTALLEDGRIVYRDAMDLGWCRWAYAHLDRYVVHTFGLTDPVLSHIAGYAPTHQAGHRWSIVPLAKDLARARVAGGLATAPLGDGEAGAFARAVRRRRAAPWIRRNARAIDAIEHRVRAPRSWRESVRVAFRRWPRVRVSRRDIDAARRRRARAGGVAARR
jgi:hypothetical protein